jgi:branched-chain amino acid transport system substrate-binding protein
MIRRSCAPLRRLAILAALALACVPSAGFPAVDPVVVPAILPLTGNGAFYGHQMEIAVKAVEAYVNKNGGINGRPVSFLIEDDQSNAQIGVQLAQELRAKHVPLILGPGWGQSCSALLPLNAKDGPVTYCLSNAIRPAAGSYVFSAYQATNDMLMASLRYFRERSWTRLAYLVAIDASGQDAERAIENALAAPENAGFKVVDREHFAASDLTAAAQMVRIKAADPQVIIAWAAGAPGGMVLRAEFNAGLNLPTLTSGANLNAAILKGQWSGFLPTNLLFPGSTAASTDVANTRAWKSAVKTFVDAIAAFDARPDQVIGGTWDPTMLVISALRKVGPNASAEQLRDYLARTKNWTGVLGSYDFAAIPQRGLGVNSVVMIRWDNAKSEFVAASHPGGAALSGR